MEKLKKEKSYRKSKEIKKMKKKKGNEKSGSFLTATSEVTQVKESKAISVAKVPAS